VRTRSWSFVGVLSLLAASSVAQARMPAENRLAAEAFQAAVRGEREFASDFMVEPPAGDERAFLMNLGACEASGLQEGGGNSVRITWSCNSEGLHFQKYVILWMDEGKIARVGIFDCSRGDGRRACNG